MEKRLPASMPGMTGVVVEGARDPRGGAEERGRASSRENSPQAHMAELKHPYVGVKQKIFSVSMLSVSRSLLLWRYCVLAGLFYFAHNPPGMLTVVEARQGCFRSSGLRLQCHGQCVEGAINVYIKLHLFFGKKSILYKFALLACLLF